MCDNGITAIIPPMAELNKIQVKPDEILIVKIDTNRFNISEVHNIYMNIRNNLPEGITAICIPIGVELEVLTVQKTIETLEKLL